MNPNRRRCNNAVSPYAFAVANHGSYFLVAVRGWNVFCLEVFGVCSKAVRYCEYTCFPVSNLHFLSS